MIGLFWSPSSHLFKVATPYLLLLPALLSALLNPKAWLFSLRSPVVGLLLLYLTYMVVLAITLNGDKAVEFSKWSLYIVLFVFSIGARMEISERTLALLLLGGAIVASTSGIYTIYRDIGSGVFWHPLYRLMGYGTLNNELRTGFLFGAFSLFAFWCMQNARLSYTQRIFGAVAAIICLTTTLLTGSRAPLLALAAVGIVITTSQKRWLQLTLVIAISTIYLPCSGIALASEDYHCALKFGAMSGNNVSIIPGLASVSAAPPIEVPTSLGIKYNTHNIFLAVLYQGGVIGLLLFAAMIVTTFYQSWSLRHVTAFGTLAALLQLFATTALQFDGVALCTRPDDNWVLLWLPIALHLYARRAAAAKATTANTLSPCAAS